MTAQPADSPREPLIHYEHVTKIYPYPRRSPFEKRRYQHAVDDLSLDIYPGETLGLVGESGSGKSTLGRMLAGLLPPDEGRILLGGTPLPDLEPLTLHRRVQYIFQDPKASLHAHKTVGWLLEEPLRVQTDMSQDARRRRVRELLSMAGLSDDYLGYYPRELSGGQAQRISILAAIINEPDVLIADEAVSALDVSVQAQVLNFLMDLKARMGLTMIFITHDIHVCYHVSDRIAVMQDGKLVEQGNAEQVYRHPEAAYTRELFGSVLSLRPRQADDINGQGPDDRGKPDKESGQNDAHGRRTHGTAPKGRQA